MNIYNSINSFMKSKYKKWIYYLLILLIITYFTLIYIIPKQTQTDKEVLIDVRSKTEWLLNHKPDAIHIPYYQLNELDLPKATKLVLYCNSGRRATIGKKILEKRGYTNITVQNG
jgi:hypothetical protein